MVPIFKTEEENDKIISKFKEIEKSLKAKGISVKIDDRDNLRSGFKFAEWELKGVPVRVAMGPRDLENGTVEIARRDTLTKEFINQADVIDKIEFLMEDIQSNIYKKALDFRELNTIKVDDYETFKEKIEEGGFLLCHWDGSHETEEKIKNETKATIRCIPFDIESEEGKCMVTGKPSKGRVIFARAY
jgi:prolyl-tRNA synthetase